MRAELRAAVAEVRSEIQMIELRRQLEAQKESVRRGWRRLYGACILSVIVNAVSVFGAMFALAKLLGH